MILLHRKRYYSAVVGIVFSAVCIAVSIPHVHADLFIALEGIGTAFTATMSLLAGGELVLGYKQILYGVTIPVTAICSGTVMISMSVSDHVTATDTLDPILSPVLGFISAAAVAASFDTQRTWRYLLIMGSSATAVMLLQLVTVLKHWTSTPWQMLFIVCWCMVDFRVKACSLLVNTPCIHTPCVFGLLQIVSAAVLSPRWYNTPMCHDWKQVVGYALVLYGVFTISRLSLHSMRM